MLGLTVTHAPRNTKDEGKCWRAVAPSCGRVLPCHANTPSRPVERCDERGRGEGPSVESSDQEPERKRKRARTVTTFLYGGVLLVVILFLFFLLCSFSWALCVSLSRRSCWWCWCTKGKERKRQHQHHQERPKAQNSLRVSSWLGFPFLSYLSPNHDTEGGKTFFVAWWWWAGTGHWSVTTFLYLGLSLRSFTSAQSVPRPQNTTTKTRGREGRPP